MVKVQITKNEIEKMIKDQLGVDNIKWGKEGDITIEIDISNIKKDKGSITIIQPLPYPVYPIKPCNPIKPIWYIEPVKYTSPYKYSLTYNN